MEEILVIRNYFKIGIFNMENQELCHIIYCDHSSEFWKLIHRIMPNYEIRKEKLLKDGWKYCL